MHIETVLCGTLYKGRSGDIKTQVKMSVFPFQNNCVSYSVDSCWGKTPKGSVQSASFLLYFSESDTMNIPAAVFILWPFPLSFCQKSWFWCHPSPGSLSYLYTSEVIPFPYSNIQKREAHCLCRNFDNLTGRTVIQILSFWMQQDQPGLST